MKFKNIRGYSNGKIKFKNIQDFRRPVRTLILSKTVKEKDLGVTMNANMKVSEQCRIAASKGNQILGMIRRNITYKEKSLIVPLYKAIVRPYLEYYIQAWNPSISGKT